MLTIGYRQPVFSSYLAMAQVSQLGNKCYKVLETQLTEHACTLYQLASTNACLYNLLSIGTIVVK